MHLLSTSPLLDWPLKSFFLAKNLEISIFCNLNYEASQMKIALLTFCNIIALFKTNFMIWYPTFFCRSCRYALIKEKKLRLKYTPKCTLKIYTNNLRKSFLFSVNNSEQICLAKTSDIRKNATRPGNSDISLCLNFDH